MFLISAQMNPGACTVAAFGDAQTRFKIQTSNLLTVAVYIAILNDSTRYQALPGNADPEALPRFSRGRASGH